MTTTHPPPAPPLVDDAQRRDRWRVRPGPRTLVAIGIGALAFDLGVRHPIGVLSFVAVLLTATAAAIGGWARERTAATMLGLACLTATFLVVRTSVWLVPLNIVTIIVLLTLAAATRPDAGAVAGAFGRLLRPGTALRPAAAGFDLAARSAREIVSGRDAMKRQVVRIISGLALAVPVSFALLALLAASDALFQSWVHVPFDVELIGRHGFTVAVGAVLTTGLVGHGAWKPVRSPRPPVALLGPTEATVVLGGMVAVYLGFVSSQVMAIARGSAYVQRTTGLTYAEYARAGFFQLVAAAVLTLVVLMMLARHRRPATTGAGRRILTLELATVALTLTTVAVAIRRLFLYEAEFGLTMLRLYTMAFAAFIGFVFVTVGLTRTGRLRHPLTTVLTGALACLLTMNAVNPERLVARRNITRFGGTTDLDVDYLVRSLGDDALPTILTDPAAAAVICRNPPSIDDRWITFSVGRERAAAALDRTCGDQPG